MIVLKRAAAVIDLQTQLVQRLRAYGVPLDGPAPPTLREKIRVAILLKNLRDVVFEYQVNDNAETFELAFMRCYGIPLDQRVRERPVPLIPPTRKAP